MLVRQELWEQETKTIEDSNLDWRRGQNFSKGREPRVERNIQQQAVLEWQLQVEGSTQTLRVPVEAEFVGYKALYGYIYHQRCTHVPMEGNIHVLRVEMWIMAG